MSSSDSDASDAQPDFTLIYKAANFLRKDLDALIARFVAAHAERFAGRGGGGGGGGGVEACEHDLAFTELHADFVAQFERMLEEYVRDECQGLTTEQAFQLFLDGAKDTLEGRFMPLFCEDEDPNRAFVESLLATMDYAHFHAMLTAAAGEATTAPTSMAGQKSSSSSSSSHSSSSASSAGRKHK